MPEAYPQSDQPGQQINRLTPVRREWPSEETSFKDGSKTIRYLTDVPRRVYRLEYDAIEQGFYDQIVAHYDSCHGQALSFAFTHPRTDEELNVRYLEFNPDVRIEGIDPYVRPSLVVVLEEVL